MNHQSKSSDRVEIHEWQLPAWQGGARIDVLPKYIHGAKILLMGCTEDRRFLVLDVKPMKGPARRITIGATELGMWIESKGRHQHPSRGAASK